ncbi:MAG: UDP-N-acetylglucosamine 2-epimerase (non-hydrolyzing) [Bacteroidales bacterium]|nr:UDP-N-acetylglucosamine 2-epimerase (non-hydrolyzing) [Bacteroidales bacterium]
MNKSGEHHTMSKIGIILGTRPEIIKLSPIIHGIDKQHLPYFLIHTGQHYSYELDQVFFDELKLPQPAYNLHIGSAPHGEQTGKMLIGIEQILLKEKPDIVLVLGDPNSALAGALAAAKLHIPVCHIEAGRRSHNRSMPEELNRLMIDQIADFLFTPNEWTRQNLLNEGISEDRIIVSGDPIVDVVTSSKETAAAHSDILQRLSLESEKYFLITLHRPENTDNPNKLQAILNTLDSISAKYAYPVIFPCHPRTKKVLAMHKLIPKNILITDPLGYMDFLQLETHASVILTDSGSMQEEACILHTPCVTLRDDTERPETVQIGANILAGTRPESILDAVESMLHTERNWPNPFGKPGVSERIIRDVLHIFKKI